MKFTNQRQTHSDPYRWCVSLCVDIIHSHTIYIVLYIREDSALTLSSNAHSLNVKKTTGTQIKAARNHKVNHKTLYQAKRAPRRYIFWLLRASS